MAYLEAREREREDLLPPSMKPSGTCMCISYSTGAAGCGCWPQTATALPLNGCFGPRNWAATIVSAPEMGRQQLFRLQKWDGNSCFGSRNGGWQQLIVRRVLGIQAAHQKTTTPHDTPTCDVAFGAVIAPKTPRACAQKRHKSSLLARIPRVTCERAESKRW